tara:strand:+ start:444 stop:1061 length:618 start_codon:yes stop_codon:yes gene_type:complete
MANIDAAFGLRPYKMLGAGANTSGLVSYPIQTIATAGSASVIYQGTTVIPLANGMLDIVGNANGGTVPILGVFMGCEYTDLNGTPTFNNQYPGTAAVKANTAVTGLISANPDQLFLINCDAAAADLIVHANANLATGITGNSLNGISYGELAVSTVNTTNTLNLRIIGFEDTPDNDDATVAGRLAIVLLNNHFYRYNANGTGAGI